MTRDLLADMSYWNEWITFDKEAILHRIQSSTTPAIDISYEPQYVRDLAFMHLKLLLRCYSRGDSISQLSHFFEPLLHFWEQAERLGEDVWSTEQQRIRRTWSVNLNFYTDCFWLVGLALALKIPDDQWRRLIALVGNDGEDMLLDRIIATRTPSRRIASSLCYPEPYARLLKAVDASATEQPALLAAFVVHWYADIGRAAKLGRTKQAMPSREPYWRGYHYPMKGAYFGYWCIEAVAAAAAFELDDSLCLGHPNYPGDFLHLGAVTTSDMSRLTPELAASISASSEKFPTRESNRFTSWQILKLLVKNKLGR